MSWLDQFAAGNTGGIAQGAIRIDTRSLAQSRAIVVREAQVMGDAMTKRLGGGTEAGVKQAVSALDRLETQLSSVHKTTSILFAAITASGLKSVQSVKTLEARFRLLEGSEADATKQLAALRELARDTKQPFLDVVEGATAIMPALRGTNADLTKTLTLVQRLAILDPVQGVQGAAFAVREFLNGEYLSLVRRLELDRKRLQQIRDQAGGDEAKAILMLSDYIAELGITEDALKEFGDSGATAFAVLRSEGTETLAAFFDPLLNEFVIPLVQALGDLLRALRNVSPEMQKLVGISAGLYALTAAGGTLPLVGKIPGGGTIAKAAGVGLAGYLGAQAGVGATRVLGEAGVGGFERYRGRSQADVGSEITTRIKQVAVILAEGLMWVSRQLRTGGMVIVNVFDNLKASLQYAAANVVNALASLVGVFTEAGASMVDAIASLLESIDTIDLGPFGKKSLGTADTAASLRTFAEGLRSLDDGMRTSDETMQGYLDTMHRGIGITQAQRDELNAMEDAQNKLVVSFGESIGVIDKVKSHWERVFEAAQNWTRPSAAETPTPDLAINEELVAEWERFQDELAAIEAEAQADRLEEVANYEARKAELIADYQQRIVQMLEEESIRYQRALEETTRRESDIRADLAEKMADADADHQKKVGELLKSYNESTERATEEHLRRLEAIERDGKRSIADAAMRLDAVALWRAQQKMREDLEQERDSYQREQEERREALEEALRQETASYDERLQAARVAAEKQIQQLWERFTREEQMNREDMARKLALMQQSHQQELAQLSTQHQARLAQITASANAESQRLEKSFIDTFNKLQIDAGNHQAVLADVHRKGQAQIEADLRAWYAAQKAIVQSELGTMVGSILGASVTTVGSLLGATVGSQASGGTIGETGKYMMHAGEEVISRPYATALRSLMGGDVSQPALVSAAAAGMGKGGGVSVGQISISVAGVSSPQETGQEVARQVKQVLWELLTA